MQILSTHSPKVKLFGTPCTPEEASIIIIPVPWEVTVSSRSGTAMGPESILKASSQLAAFPQEYIDGEKLGIAMLPIPHDWKVLSDALRHQTVRHIHAMESGHAETQFKSSIAHKIDQYASELKTQVRQKATEYLQQGKMVAVLGGDHSTPLGLMEALAEHYNNMGILHIDAHPAMHHAHQGVKYSHASIMHNALDLAHVVQIAQVGLRSYSPEEIKAIRTHAGRVFPFFINDMKRKRLQGTTWHDICEPIVEILPERVYISFDIDGLDAKLCPSTGSPVPNGLALDEVYYLLEAIVRGGKKIIGFDLCEVAPGENMDWDAQVGSRVLQQLCMAMGASQGKVSMRS